MLEFNLRLEGCEEPESSCEGVTERFLEFGIALVDRVRFFPREGTEGSVIVIGGGGIGDAGIGDGDAGQMEGGGFGTSVVATHPHGSGSTAEEENPTDDKSGTGHSIATKGDEDRPTTESAYSGESLTIITFGVRSPKLRHASVVVENFVTRISEEALLNEAPDPNRSAELTPLETKRMELTVMW